MTETHFSCDIVGRELWFAIVRCCALKRTGTSVRIGKQGNVFSLCFDVSFLTPIGESTVVLVIGFVKFEITQWFSAVKTKFVRGLVSLDCRLTLLENFFWVIF